MKTHSHYNKYN